VNQIAFQWIPDFDQLASQLPIHRGDILTDELVRQTAETVREFGEGLQVQVNRGPDGRANIIVYDPQAAWPQRIKIEPAVQAAMLMAKTPPVLPPQAGAVRLSIIVGRDGTVWQTSPLTGADESVAAAMEAVKQWKYRPTVLNGVPVEIQSTVEFPGE